MTDDKKINTYGFNLVTTYSNNTIKELMEILQVFEDQWHSRDSKVKEVDARVKLIFQYTNLLTNYNDALIHKNALSTLNVYLLYCFTIEWPELSTELLPRKTKPFDRDLTDLLQRFIVLKEKLDVAIKNNPLAINAEQKREFDNLRKQAQLGIKY
jgi:hypothetical protein